jgi:hypothetical protein
MRFEEGSRVQSSQEHTMLVGFGALTGSPFALTGARVPSLSPFRCSRWICHSLPLAYFLALWLDLKCKMQIMGEGREMLRPRSLGV